MRRSGKGSGGGFGMNKNVRPKVRTGGPNRRVREGFAGQIGVSVGNKADKGNTGYRGEGFGGSKALNPAELGNACALYSAGSKAGPGSDRTVLARGTQGTHGPVNKGQSPVRRDILRDFGPDYKGER